MKVGDLVKLITDYDWPMAIIVSIDSSNWFWVVQSDGTHRLWPSSQMELVYE